MRKEILLSAIIISLGLIFSISNIALALSADINYPIKDLGGCQNEKECRTYCDKPENIGVCVAFSKKNDLISGEEAKIAENFMASKNKPGDCKNQKDCEIYCNDISRIDECVAFSEKNNLMPPKELEEAKKIQAALKQGAKTPGGCKTKEQCDAYCESPNHMEECINFAVDNGVMEGKELEEAKKMLQAVKKGAKPPPCKNKKDCDSYCSEENHFDECISFAEAAGFVSKEEAVMVRKTGGKGPGNCKGKEECDAFCQSNEENMVICAEFAFSNGMMTKKEYEMMKKTGGKGPGGCKGKEKCELFCDNPDNQETCFQFGRDNGMIPEEELKKMGEGKQQFQKSFENMPPEVTDCISQKVGPEMFAKFKDGTIMPSRNTGESLRECFEKMGPPPGEMGPPCEGANCQPPQEGQGVFNRARGFINQMMPGKNQNNGQSASTKLSIKKDSSGLYIIEINEPNGIKEFSFTSEGSNPYSGGLSGCPKDYSNQTTVNFPVKAKITDCKDGIHEFDIQAEGDFKSGGNNQEIQEGPQSDGINITSGSAGPGGCKSPQECGEFCKNNPQECMNFRPAGEQQICEGENCLPSETQPQQGSGIFNRTKNFIRKFAPGTEGGVPPGPPCEGANCQPPGEIGPPREEFKCEGDNCPPPDGADQQQEGGIFNRTRNFIRQFAPNAKEGTQPSQQCEGNNCPPQKEMGPSNETQQGIRRGDNRTYVPPRENIKFEGDNKFRIPSPDEINQIQERMMRENEGARYMEQGPANGTQSQQKESQFIRPEMPIYEQREIQTMPGTSRDPIPPTNMGPINNYQSPTQLNQPTDFQRPLENSPPPSGSFQSPMNFQQSPPSTNTQPPPSTEPQPTSFKLTTDKAIASAISQLIYSPNCKAASTLCVFKQSAQNQISDLISDKIYPPAEFNKSDSPLRNLKEELQNEISELIAENLYKR